MGSLSISSIVSSKAPRRTLALAANRCEGVGDSARDVHGLTTSELEVRRYKAAVAELKAAGLYTSFRNDDGPSRWELAFQAGRPFEYLPLRRNLIIMAVIGIIVGSIATLLFYGHRSDLFPRLLVSIVLQGLMLPLAIITIVWRKAQRHGLTKWEDLAG